MQRKLPKNLRKSLVTNEIHKSPRDHMYVTGILKACSIRDTSIKITSVIWTSAPLQAVGFRLQNRTRFPFGKGRHMVAFSFCVCSADWGCSQGCPWAMDNAQYLIFKNEAYLGCTGEITAICYASIIGLLALSSNSLLMSPRETYRNLIWWRISPTIGLPLLTLQAVT